MRVLGSVLLAASAAWARPRLQSRAGAVTVPGVFDTCVKANDIALTFDDGPYIHLRNISDQFTAAGAKATFFWNGNNWDCIYNADRIADIKYAYAAGHMLGSHTWSHADLLGITDAQLKDAMFRMEEAFSRILGIKPAFMRPPFGDYDDNVASIAAGRGQSLALWDWDTGDADGNTTAQSEAVYNDVIAAKVSTAVILEHETEPHTFDTLVPFAIKLFQSHGYNLVTLADCLGVAPYQAIGVPQQQTSAWTCDGTPDPGDLCGGSIACETGFPVFSSTAGPTSTSTSTTKTSTSTTPTATPTGHQIQPGASTAVCLAAPSNADGGTVVINPCDHSASQTWTQVANTFVIYGNKCLDVTNGNTTNGNKMQIWTCSSGNVNQGWSVTTDHRIAWTNHGECLDLSGGRVTAGNQIQMWLCEDGNNNQVWNIV